jgi:putative endonuclease
MSISSGCPSGRPDARRWRQRRGAWGEEVVSRSYEDQGYQIAARNWRCSAGELDLVAVGDGGRLVVFVEVRTRSSDAFGSPAASVTQAKRRRWRRAAAAWLAADRAGGPDGPGRRVVRPGAVVRFDLAAVRPGPAGQASVEVVQDAI